MARELRITYPVASANLYAIIRRPSDGYVWNGSAFAAWANGSIADYDIALTDRSGDLYDGDFPSGITNGLYRVTFYIRSGATPAITDDALLTIERYWNGTALADGSSVSLDAYALTTLAIVKEFMRIDTTDDDTLLTRLINQCSAFIETVTGRKFKAREYTERINGLGQRRLQSTHRPIQYIARLAYGRAQSFGVTYSGAGITANVACSTDRIRLVSVSAAGTATETSLLFTDYPTASTLVTAINTVSGWTATLLNDHPAKWLIPSGGEDAKGRTVYVDYPDIADIQYSADYSRGEIEISTDTARMWGGSRYNSPINQVHREWRQPFARSHQEYVLTYTAGYDTIPADVQQACAELVQSKYYTGLDNPSVKSTALGPYSISFGDSDAQAIRDTLAMYCDGSNLIAG